MGTDRVEPVIKLLCLLMLFFTAVLIYCSHLFPTDGVVFAVFSGILNNCAGALFMRVKQAHDAPLSLSVQTPQSTSQISSSPQV